MPLPLLTSLLILIVAARLLGRLFERFDQPSIVGEMLAGVLLGPSVFGLVHTSQALSGIAELAVFLVVLSAGLEMKFKDIVNVLSGKGIVIAFLGLVIPLISGVVVGIAFREDVMRTVFLALCISITALPVTVRILQSFNMLDSLIARYSAATAIFNDVAALLILGVIINIPETRSFETIGTMTLQTMGKLGIFASVLLSFNWVVATIINRGIHIERIPEKLVAIFGTEALFGIVVVFALVFASISEMLGFHFVIGAFFGALVIEQKYFFASRYREMERTLDSLTNGFLAPVFFAYLGLEFNIEAISSLSFAVVVLIVSVASKVFAGWFGGRLLKLSATDSLGIGIILNGRGVMELVVAGIAYQKGFIGQGLFSTLVLMGVVTTMLTPIMFKRWVIPRMTEKGNGSVVTKIE